MVIRRRGLVLIAVLFASKSKEATLAALLWSRGSLIAGAVFGAAAVSEQRNGGIARAWDDRHDLWGLLQCAHGGGIWSDSGD